MTYKSSNGPCLDETLDVLLDVFASRKWLHDAVAERASGQFQGPDVLTETAGGLQ